MSTLSLYDVAAVLQRDITRLATGGDRHSNTVQRTRAAQACTVEAIGAGR